ncbi:hypothetical protein elemo25C_phanotate15 [Flavobacterium phage vB_FspP_elemoA_2-5C]|jgi:hypothetical protein|nr:hypothetical protein elemo25C_phanotate15 [Flavobacterium phage vB_FspP_elemoA_2-5C]
MTLRDKFKKCKDVSNSYYVLPIADDAEQLEQIADEFAIEFAEWYLNLWHTDDDSSFDNKSPQELLEIFKKEKGL